MLAIKHHVFSSETHVCPNCTYLALNSMLEEELDGQTRLYSSHDTTQHTHAATHTLILTVAGEILSLHLLSHPGLSFLRGAG